MNELNKSYGINAGKVWDVLYNKGPQVQTKLVKMTNMTDDEFYGAVGWLARENKIFKDKRTFKLGETNLTDKIGENAGKVWNVLSRSTEIDISAITRLLKMNKTDCYSAIGWLAREGKITTKITLKRK